MRILDGLEALPDLERDQGCVATVGVFDGVHLGHFMVLRRVVDRARELGTRPVMVTFARHPKAVLLGHAPPTITSLEHRLVLFERAGIETTLVLDFTDELRGLTAEQFVRRVLLDGLGLRELIFGFDSKFGRDRGGNPESLRPLAEELGFGIEEVQPVALGERPVSSTFVREAVQLGDLQAAARMLGRPVSLLGTVVPGDRLGRELGFPTANLRPHHELRPPHGVYLAMVLHQEQLHPAVVNIGERPSLAGKEVRIEAHLLDFEGDLYQQVLEVFLLERLRPEREFPDMDALRTAIGQDVDEARGRLPELLQSWRIPGRYLPIEGGSAEELAAPDSRC
ncbi:MAG: riboflavin biosynthesis protein RibF [Planctomycetes bacterium]|nr:riboflavin biosynthesis protein RibF [Planctomycetota bacterium]